MHHTQPSRLWEIPALMTRNSHKPLTQNRRLYACKNRNMKRGERLTRVWLKWAEEVERIWERRLLVAAMAELRASSTVFWANDACWTACSIHGFDCSNLSNAFCIEYWSLGFSIEEEDEDGEGDDPSTVSIVDNIWFTVSPLSSLTRNCYDG